MLRALLTLVIVTIPARTETAPEAFERGLACYQKQDYACARDAFGAAIKVGPPTARLYHDLALAHFRLDEKPRALGLWRKALALNPNFAPARAGRALLESGARMRAYEGEGALHAARGVLERVSPFVLSWILALGLAACAWSGFRLAHQRRSARTEDTALPPTPPSLAAFVGTTALVGLALGLRLYLVDDMFATVVAERAQARSLPNARAVTLFELSGGGEVLVKRAQNGWAQIETPDGSVGWIEDRDLEAGTGS